MSAAVTRGTTPTPLRYACQEKLVPGATDDERTALARELGFDGIEINARLENPLAARAASLRAALGKSGCAAAAVCGGYRGWLGHFDPELRALAVRDIKALLPVVAELGAHGIIVPAAYGMFSRKLPPFTPPRGEAEDRAALVDSLGAVGEEALRCGVAVYLEPLNRYEDHMVNTLAQAGELAAALESGAVYSMIDCFHASLEEVDCAGAVRDAAAAPGGRRAARHVHLADSNRLEPGAGHVDFRSILAALRDTGFSGFCSFECELSGPAPAALSRSVAFLRQLEAGIAAASPKKHA